MNGLEALNKWLKEYLHLCEKLNTNQQEKMLLDTNSPYNILKQHFETIDNSKPSEALECLKDVEELEELVQMNKKMKYKNIFIFNLNTIKQALTTKSKKELAFEIIKEKDVDVYWLKDSKTIEEYNKRVATKEKLTQEEFETLKEVL